MALGRKGLVMTKRELCQMLDAFEDDDIIVLGNTDYDDNGDVLDVQYFEPTPPEYWDENKGVIVLYPGQLISG